MGEAAERSARLRVLVVDDEANMRLLACRSLERLGCVVIEAPDGAEALRLADEHLPHLVLLDVVMPGIDGFQVCASLRERAAFAHIPIIMMTALEDFVSVDHSYEVGATDFITKPVNWSLLQHRARFILRASEALDQLSSNQQELADAQRIAHLASWRWTCDTDEVKGSTELQNILDARDITGSCGWEEKERRRNLRWDHQQPAAGCGGREGDATRAQDYRWIGRGGRTADTGRR